MPHYHRKFAVAPSSTDAFLGRRRHLLASADTAAEGALGSAKGLCVDHGMGAVPGAVPGAAVRVHVATGLCAVLILTLGNTRKHLQDTF